MTDGKKFSSPSISIKSVERKIEKVLEKYDENVKNLAAWKNLMYL